jgi:hypothetical protein
MSRGESVENGERREGFDKGKRDLLCNNAVGSTDYADYTDFCTKASLNL